MYVASILGLALSLGAAGPAVTHSPAGSTRYAVEVRGHAGQTVHLRAVGVPVGYIASFCTRRVCAPFRVSFDLPQSGRESIELQIIENVPGSAEPKYVTITADGARASIAFSARRKR